MAEFNDPYQGSSVYKKAWLTLMPGAYERALSTEQSKYASDLKREMGPRPELGMSQYSQDALSTLESLTRIGLPAEAEKLFLDNLNASTSDALRGANTMNAGLNAVGGIYGQKTDALAELLAMDSQAMVDARKDLAGQQNLMAQQEKEMFYTNELQPYLDKQTEYQSLLGASIANRQAGNIATQQVGASAVNAGASAQSANAEAMASALPALLAMSDRRLKTNIRKIGVIKGNVPVYEYNYKSMPNEMHVGVMAQDLIELGYGDCVIEVDGYYMVNYSKLLK